MWFFLVKKKKDYLVQVPKGKEKSAKNIEK